MTWSTFRDSLLLSILAMPIAAEACSVSHIPSGIELVTNADVVIRARAVDYKTPPANPSIWTTGVPDSVVSFQVLETIRGETPLNLPLHGYLTQRDDFNDQKPPYTFVRPGGRSGSCFANSYRQGTEYLLFLKRSNASGALTVNWAALAPVNEQLHDINDPWLIWVRTQAKQVRN
jgi:hypothetical protein